MSVVCALAGAAWLGLVGVASAEDAALGGGVVDRIAAVVGVEVIALSEVYELAGNEFFLERCPALDAPCVTSAELEVLDVLLRRALIRQELARLAIDVTAADVDQAIDRTVRQYALPDRQALRAEVEKSGKRWDQYRDELFEYLRTQAFQMRVLAPRVSIRDDELQDEYHRTARGLEEPYAAVSAFGIPIDPAASPADQAKTVEQTGILVNAIREGRVTWDDAVAQYDGAGIASMFTGRQFTAGSLVEPVDAVVFSSSAGTIADPVRVADVLFVLRIDERGERADVATFDEARERLHDQLFQRKLQEAEEEWYQRARREAAIDVKLKG